MCSLRVVLPEIIDGASWGSSIEVASVGAPFHGESLDRYFGPTPGAGRHRLAFVGMRRGDEARIQHGRAGEFPRPCGGEARPIAADAFISRRGHPLDLPGERGRRSDPSACGLCRSTRPDCRVNRSRRPARRRHPGDERQGEMDRAGPGPDHARRPPGPRCAIRGQLAPRVREGDGEGADPGDRQPALSGDHGRPGLQGHRGEPRPVRQVVRAAAESPRDRECGARLPRRPGLPPEPDHDAPRGRAAGLDARPGRRARSRPPGFRTGPDRRGPGGSDDDSATGPGRASGPRSYPTAAPAWGCDARPETATVRRSGRAGR